MNKLNKLSAINIVISNIGMSPVGSIESANPMVAKASAIIDEVSHSVQSEGWSFNTESGYPFNPSGGFIVMPDNILQFDVDQFSNKDLILRSGKLYDKAAHAFVNEPINLDVIWCFDFEDLPEAVKKYIAVRAANLFAGRAVGSSEQVKFGEREEAAARANLLEYETQQGDYNMLGNSNNQKIRTYLPFNTINRF